MTARLYGRVNGWSSHAVVTRGFEIALEQAGLLAGVYPVDDVDEEQHYPGALAPVALYTAHLGALAEMRAMHAVRGVMVAPNSDVIPEVLVRALQDCATTLLAPSAWGAEVLRARLPGKPVVVAPHGILPGYGLQPQLREQARSSYRSGELVVLHLSTTTGERKGTRQLVEAWGQLRRHGRLGPKARLVLVLDHMSAGRLAQDVVDFDLDLEQIVTVDRMGAGLGGSPAMMARLYSNAHLVCQPSRGEGYGLCPVEALACGVPIVVTSCTGHSEWVPTVHAGVVLVEHGPLASIDDGPGAQAPEVTSESIAASLDVAIERWPELARSAEEASPEVAARHSWQNALAPLVSAIKEGRLE